MSDLSIECSCDPEEIAYAVWHEMHKRRPQEYDVGDERLDCGYCNRDFFYARDGSGKTLDPLGVNEHSTPWRVAYEQFKAERRK